MKLQLVQLTCKTVTEIYRYMLCIRTMSYLLARKYTVCSASVGKTRYKIDHICIVRRKFGWPMPSLIPGIKCVVCYGYICCCLPCSLSTTTTPRSSTTTPPTCRFSWYAVVLISMSESSNSLSDLSEATARHFRVHLRYR